MRDRPMEMRADAGVSPEPMPVLKTRLRPAFGTWVPALTLVLLAVISTVWLSQLGGRDVQQKRFEGHAPDLTMEEFEVTTMGEDGSPSHRLSAAYMAHFADTQTKELTHPHLVVYREEAEPWHVASERGWVSADNDVLMLLGEVNIWRNRPDGKREIHIETEDLRVLPDDEYAETALPVSISTPESHTRGTGMRAYLGDSRVQLLSKVRTTIDPVVR
jgi:lipopolysaccharide export system protein LptC